MKYNIHHKHKDLIKNLALEAETAINLLPPIDQEPIRYQVAKNIQILYNQQKPHHTHTHTPIKKEMKTIRDIRKKLEENNAIITKADKGNSIVIIENDSYQEKIMQFIKNNESIILDKNYTKKYQKDIRTAINTCRTPIQKATKWKFINLNPSPLQSET